MLDQSLLLLLAKVNHLHPYMLNLAYRENLGTKFLYQLIPISLNFERRNEYHFIASSASE
jgi:hypothetical protein